MVFVGFADLVEEDLPFGREEPVGAGDDVDVRPFEALGAVAGAVAVGVDVAGVDVAGVDVAGADFVGDALGGIGPVGDVDPAAALPEPVAEAAPFVGAAPPVTGFLVTDPVGSGDVLDLSVGRGAGVAGRDDGAGALKMSWAGCCNRAGRPPVAAATATPAAAVPAPTTTEARILVVNRRLLPPATGEALPVDPAVRRK